MLFGVSGSTLSDWLHFGRHCCLNIVLYDNVHAKIEMGSEEKIRLWKEAIAAKYPDLGNVYLAVDGLKLRIQKQVMTESKTIFIMVGKVIIM